MKDCPNCGTRYTDDSLQFCLQDGSPLRHSVAAEQDAETIVSRRHGGIREQVDPVAEPGGVYETSPDPRSIPPQRRSRIMPIVIVTALVTLLIFSIGGIAVWLLTHDNQSAARPSGNNPRGQVSPTSPPIAQTATPTPAISPTPANNANTAAAEPVADKSAISRQISDVIGEWESNTESFNIDELIGRYADRVDYYRSGATSRAAVARDKERAFSQFDSIDFRISNVKIDVSDAGDTAIAEFDKEWTFEGERVSEGRVRSQLRFRKVNNRWLITSEKDLKVY